MEEMTKVTEANDGFGVPENRSASPIIGKMVKFNDGRFIVDKTSELASDATLVVVGIWTGWVHWMDGEVAEHRKTQEGQVHPEREDLPDQDESLWPPSRFTDGGEDPWKDTRYVRLIDPATGMDYTVVGDTFGMRKGVGELKSQIRNVRTAHPTAFPIVQLRSGTMPSKKYGPKKYPTFLIVGWHGRGQETQPVQTPPAAIERYKPKQRDDDPITTGPQPINTDDIDMDAIPFAPRD
jgi:hypothetical protein